MRITTLDPVSLDSNTQKDKLQTSLWTVNQTIWLPRLLCLHCLTNKLCKTWLELFLHAWADIWQSKLHAVFSAWCIIIFSAILYSTDYGNTINIVSHPTWFLEAAAQSHALLFGVIFFFPGELLVVLEYTCMYAVEIFVSKKRCLAFVSVGFTLFKYCIPQALVKFPEGSVYL